MVFLEEHNIHKYIEKSYHGFKKVVVFLQIDLTSGMLLGTADKCVSLRVPRIDALNS